MSRATTIFVIRHGDAGDAAAWRGDDADRPLSAKGREQARRLADNPRLSASGPLLSSPLRRCTETIEPLAERLGRGLELEDWLATGEDPLVALDFLLARAQKLDRAPALCACTHGDLIDGFVEAFQQQDVAFAREPIVSKGAIITIELCDDVPSRVDFEAPPRLSKAARK